MKQKIVNRNAANPTSEVVDAARKAIRDVTVSLPLSGGIPPNERKGMVKINVGNKVFAEDALAAAKTHADVLPGYVSVPELESRMESYEAFDGLIQDTLELVGKLRDTQTVIGSEAYAMALTMYHIFERAFEDGVPGMETVCRQLGERFKGQGNFGADKNKDQEA